MKTNEDWSEIVDTLRPYLNGNPGSPSCSDIHFCASARFILPGITKTSLSPSSEGVT